MERTLARKIFALAFALGAFVAPAAAERVLVGDFIVVGRVHAGVSRSLASVELVNETGHALDVRLGKGTARLKSKETLLVRTPGGDVELSVSSPTLPGEELAGTLKVEQALHYAILFTYDELPVIPPAPPSLELSLPGTSTAPSARTEVKPESLPPVPTEARTPSTAPTKRKPSWKKTKRSGRVDVGRKRKRDRP